MATKQLLTRTLVALLFTAVVQSELKCNFEVDTCQWYLSKGWIRSQGKISHLETDPPDDHSNRDGFYLHLDARHLEPDDKAFLFSPPTLDEKKKYCLSFLYLMHGKQVATLSVHVLNMTSSTEVWAASFKHGPKWLHQKVAIENGRQVLFEGVSGGKLGNIAIDEVEIKEGVCFTKGDLLVSPYAAVRLPFICTFEKDEFCGFHNPIFTATNWQRGPSRSFWGDVTGHIDHTLQTYKGHYLHLTTEGLFSGGKATLTSPTFKANKEACLQFWYNIYGSGTLELSVNINDQKQLAIKNSQGFGWKSAFISIKGSKSFKVAFKGRVSIFHKGHIAIDDISIQEIKCPQSVDCSFENPLCAWSNSGDDDFDWSHQTGNRGKQSLGPSTDHTLGSKNGTFLMIESSPNRRQGDRARLVSTTITETVKTQCLKFWYNMNGKQVGELGVFIYTLSGKSLRWKLIGPKGGLWAFASLPIPRSRQNFWIVIEGVVKEPSKSYIAIDDISLAEGKCTIAPVEATVGWKPTTRHLSAKSTAPPTTLNPSKIILSCDFTRDFCGWQQGKHDVSDWIRTHLSTPSKLTGPKTDHTTGDGSYIYVEASDHKVGPVRLLSRIIKPTHGSMCLKFWYFMYGRDVDILQVYIAPKTGYRSDRDTHWKMAGSKANKWLLAEIFFQAKQDFMILFEARLNGKFAGDIALDDILLTSGSCTSGEEITTPKPGKKENPIPIEQRNCDFESKNICGYVHEKGSPNYFWLWGSGETESIKTGPSTDHTTNSAEGHYMYIEGSDNKPGTVARMISPLYQDSTDVCMQFYYHMYGSGIGNFSIYLLPKEETNGTQRVYFTNGDHGSDWELDRVTINKVTAAAGYKIRFEATVGMNYRADIALDDISFSPGKCPFLGDCNFEDSSCTWKNIQGDDFDWQIKTGKTWTPLTGPSFDHTLLNEKGHYMYIETSPPIKPGMKARLVSTLLPKIDKHMCLEFWYNMYGKTTGSLKVIMLVTGFSETVIWQLEGEQGKDWLYAQVPLRGTATTYTLFFEASSGAKYTGDIAIDDISFIETECRYLPEKAKVTMPTELYTTTPAATTPKPVTGDLICRFEKGLCGWIQDTHDSNDWRRHKGPTNSSNTGPPGDHSTGQGYYIYLETSKQPMGSLANLISPVFMPDKTGITCVSFWYYMYGAHVKTLNVFIQYGKMIPSSATWSQTGDQGPKWIHKNLSIKSNAPFNVILSATVGESYLGDIAVDDVSITNGDCLDDNTKIFITCDFEKKSICGFTQDKSLSYNWVWHKGNTPTMGTGPTRDHSLGTMQGHYMYVEGSKPKDYAQLSSPTIRTTGTSCVNFFYHMRGSVGLLNVYLKVGESVKRLWHRIGHQSTSWQLGTAEVENNVTKFRIMFEAINGGNNSGDIAIDDFSVIKGPCTDTGFCDFENGMCIWKNSEDDDFDWIIRTKDKSSKHNAPKSDHTKGGHFLYVSTENNPLHSRAMIETTDFEKNSKNCLHFWFNGYGKDPGTFTVSINSGGRSRALWQLSGTKVGRWPKNGKWHEARVQIPSTDSVFTITIDVVVGKSGYVAIDDVAFGNEKNCPRLPGFAKPIATKPPPTIKTTLAHTTTAKSREPSVTCDFTYDLCGWTQDKTDDQNWIRNKDYTPSARTGPLTDHTTGSGYYIYIESSDPAKPGDVARIISPKIRLKNKEKRCLTFWYHMHGETIGSLSLLLLINGKMEGPIWKRQKSQGENWIQGKVNIGGANSLQVVFEANSGSGYFGDIALDDIEIHKTTCDLEETLLPSCDFESTCNFKPTKGKIFIPWKLTSSTDHLNVTDHTYKTLSGEFLYADLKGNARVKIAQVQTPILKTGQYCMEFFYREINKFTGLFTVKTTKSSDLFEADGFSIKNEWTIAEIDINEFSPFTTIFQVNGNAHSKGIVAIDDVVFKNGKCPKPGSCDFDRGHLCFWTNDPSNKIDWTVRTGETQTRTTGPSSDHTTQNITGMYAFIESSYPANIGDQSRLISQPINNKNRHSCFTFWYNMYGSTVGDLSVSIKPISGNETKYWHLFGDQGKPWNFGRVPLPATKRNFQIVIESRIRGKYGDFAIDDLLVTEDSCGFSPAKAMAQNPMTTPSVGVTTTNSPIISGDKSFNCTFEKGTCGWTQRKIGDFHWIRNQGYTPDKATGPQGDHTTGRGYYMYLEASGYTKLKKATLTYIANNQSPGMKCMQFWYSMRGPHVGSLNIYIITEVDKPLPNWKRTGTQGPTWNLANIEFNATSTFKVMIEGVKGHGSLGDIAVDDVVLLNGGCKEPYGKCDFEELSVCGYTKDRSGDFYWKRNRGKTGSLHTGPLADHTYGTSTGHYMYIEASEPQKKNDVARLISPVFKPLPDDHCLQFYYNMFGKDIGVLNVKIRVHDSQNTTYDTNSYLHISGAQGQDWIKAQVELPKIITENPYQVIFEGIIGSGYLGDIAIDDIVINSKECEFGGNCDFDHNRCSWVNVEKDDDFDWMLGSGEAKSTGTHPLFDHTFKTASGFFLYIDSSKRNLSGQKAWYVSQNFQPNSNQGRCLTFWYNINGPQIGTLRVKIEFNTGGINTLWELGDDHQGKDWKFGQAPINSPTPYKIIFEGVRGLGDKGNIAIDDILFNEFSCSVSPITATPRGKIQTLPSLKVTTPVSPIERKLNCTFELGLCGWTQDTTDTFDWTENKGNTPESETGPSQDHSPNGNGFYLYIYTRGRYRGDDARIISPLMRPNGIQCFTVWYHMYGSNINEFNVYLFTGPDFPKPAFHRYSSQGNKWHRADIEFRSDSPYNIIIEGKSGYGRKGNIAVDDVSITDGFCVSKAVKEDIFCDFQVGKLCGFTQEKDDDFDWSRSYYRGRANIPDHTYGSTSGTFLYISSYGTRKPGEYATLSSPVFGFNTTDACVEFWYFMSGKETGTLTVSFFSDKDNFKRATPIWNREGQNGRRWKQGLIDINLAKDKITHIKVEFTGAIGPKYWEILGLDDVSISSNVCNRKKGECNFEHGNCNWVNKKDNDFDWIIGSGLTTTTKTGPFKDHTLSLQRGSYIYIQPISDFVYANNADSKEIAIIESDIFDQTQPRCFQFYFVMKEAIDGAVQIFVQPEGNNPMQLVWSLEGHQGDDWNLAQVQLPVEATPFQVMIKGFRSSRFKGQIAIDDLSFSNKSDCTILPLKAKPVFPTSKTPSTLAPIAGFDCTFDKDFCYWKHNRLTQFQWSRQRGTNKQPQSDHTGGGYFIYLDSSNMMFNNYAALFSPEFPTSSQRCLSFFYYMGGEDLNTLSIGYRTQYGLERLWKRTGPQGNKWLHATVNLPVYPGNGKGSIEIKGTGPKTGASGFMALDDISLYSGLCQEPRNKSVIDCDFEKPNVCGYLQDHLDSFDWSYGSGKTKSPKDNLPKTDHTYGTRLGHYVFIDSKERAAGTKAVLWTPPLNNTNNKCLMFWYHMFGKDIGSLKISLTDEKTSSRYEPTIWKRHGSQGDTWIQEYVPIPHQFLDSLYILFTGINGKTPGGIALDDVKLLPSCLEPGDCTFEIDTCGWENSKQNDLDWQHLNVGQLQFFKKISLNDHTTNGPLGQVMFFTSRHHSNIGKKGDLLSVSLDPTSETGLCFEFWFLIEGHNFGNLSVFTKINSTEETIKWSLSVSKSRTWTRGTFHIKSFVPFQIGFRAVITSGTSGYIAIDDVGYSGVICAVTPRRAEPAFTSTVATTIHPTTSRPIIQPGPYDCMFENGFCKWTQAPENNFDWKIGTSKVNKDLTSPLSDHTLGNSNGHYAYIKLSNLPKHQNKAKLVSPTLKEYGEMCLSFWYFMYGEDIETLRIYLRHSKYSFNVLWTRNGTLDRKWYHGYMRLYSQHSTKVIFEAVQREGQSGYIGLDDIEIKKGPCPEHKNDCNFENFDICNFKQSGEDDFDWSLGNAKDSPVLPNKDHTYKSGAGHFIYVLGNHYVNSVAQLIGPVMPHSFGSCFSFWFSSRGPILLNVYELEPGHPKMVFNYKSKSQTDWRKGSVNIKTSMTWEIMFEAIIMTGNSNNSFLALDDIKFSKGICGFSGDCSFERGSCEWHNVYGDNFDWILKRAGAGGPGPVIDHTLQNKQGYYFFIDGSGSKKAGDKAELKHRYISLNKQRYCFRFWYSMHEGMLQIGVQNGTVLWQVNGEQNPNVPYEWKYGQVSLPYRRVFGFITITGIIGSGADSYIAIDDLSFHSSPCTRIPSDSLPVNTTPLTTRKPESTTPSFVPKSPYDCSFEKGFCSWGQSKSDNLYWRRRQGPDKSKYTGPFSDHTTKTGSGWYIYLDTKLAKKGSKGLLVSPVFKSNTDYCFTYYYYMFGILLGNLNVILTNEDGSTEKLLTRNSTQGRRWRKETFNIHKHSKTFTISFEGHKGKSRYGAIALDDIIVTEGICANSGTLNCTFESPHLCGFETRDDHRGKWKKYSVNDNGRFGVSNDHTLKTQYGSYMYLALDKKDQNIAEAQLISAPINASSDFCMTFYYQIRNTSRGSLSVFQHIGHTFAFPLWTQLNEHEHGWIRAQVSLPAHQNYKVIFGGTVRNYNGFVRIDDISTEPGICSEPGNCDFEDFMCTWMNVEDGNHFNWLHINGDTPTVRTGPSTDHTTLSAYGYYIYLEASYMPRGSKAQLRSMIFSPTSGRCMRFWYHMLGAEMGALNIYFVDEKSGKKTKIWHLSGEQGNKWLYAQVAFASANTNYVIIEGIRGTSYTSDIGIDDIVFTQGYCATSPTKAQTGYVFPKAVTTPATPTWSPNMLDCSFEDKCNWQQSTDDDFDWKVHNGSTPSEETGPNKDHTLGSSSGHYIYIETSLPRKNNDKARFVSPSFIPKDNGCLQFWYFMYGPDVDSLTVYLKDNEMMKEIWTKSGNLDDVWHQGLIPIKSQNNVQIVFEGRRGARWFGDIALDDISFSFNGCPSSPDEVCGFEEPNICKFETNEKNDFHWNWFSPGRSVVTQENDHTLGTEYGHYMLASRSKNNQVKSAIMSSPNYTSITSKCIEFWYFMSETNTGILNVYLTTNESRLQLWSREGNQGSVWSLAYATVKYSGDFHIEFEAMTGDGITNIAIDDYGMFHGDCPKAGVCAFEKGWCFWTNNKTDDFDWQIGTGHLGRYGGPRQDHTTNSIKGHYIFLQAGFPIQVGSYAELVSVVFDKTFHKCMTFWYFMTETSNAILNIYTVTNKTKTLEWTLSGNQPKQSWQYGQFFIHHGNHPYKIAIEGINGAGSRISIAMDDIVLTDHICGLFPKFATSIKPRITSTQVPITTQSPETTPVPTPFDCTFEKGMCLWKQGTNDQFDWIRSQGPMGSNVTGPIKDHTLKTDNGWYVLADSSPTANILDEAVLLGPLIKASKDRCLNFWYHMYGAYIDKLIVNLSTNGINETVWMRQGDEGDAWREAFLNLPARTNTTYQIIFVSTRSRHANQPVALDDIRFTENKCHENSLNFCDFEDPNLCAFQQIKDDDFDWTWGSGSTPTFLTGPVTDHTMRSKYGHYLFIESSKRKPLKKAQIVTPKYNTTDTNCLHFFYYMYGEHVQELNVYRKDNDHYGELGTPQWSRKYNQGPIWVEGQTTIFPGNDFHIIFEGVTGNGALGDIAIDDISITSGFCQLPGFCDFEKSLCLWKNIKSDDFDWIRGRGYTETKDTGPVTDHTLGNAKGYYIYIETSDPQSPGDIARLQSEDFPSSNTSICLRFWYQMNGEDVDSLNVLVKNTDGDNNEDEAYVWSQKGDNGPKWLYAQLNVDGNYTNKDYHLIFEGIRGKGNSGDIAIDDVDVSIGACVVVPRYADPKIIALKMMRCDFDDNTFCNLQQDKNDNYDWELMKGKSRVYNSGPNADHSGSGYYISLHNHMMVKGYRAGLYSPTLGPTTGKGNCFTFYYHMYGIQIGTLNLYMRIKGKNVLRWTKSGDQGNSWKYANINIDSKYNYQIYIEVISSGGYYEVIALDDFAMDGNPCPPLRECDFSFDECGWTTQNNYKKWLYARTPTPIPDHTTGTNIGGFLYTNATSSNKGTFVSRALTPSYPPASVSCLKFWYFMDGSHPGRLHVKVDLDQTEQRVLVREGAQGNKWWLAHLDIGAPLVPLTKSYKFIFESVQESGPKRNGITAIDDVKHLPGPCLNNGVCDFEQDFCGFSNIQGDDLDWIRATGRTDVVINGIRNDHTMKSIEGHFLYVSLRVFEKNKKSWLVSWVQEKTSGTCLNFWYIVKGSGKLNVYIWTTEGKKKVWSHTKTLSADWVSASITLISKLPFSVLFESMNDDTAVLALDDIKFQSGSCGSQTTPSVSIVTQPPTLASLFRCGFEHGLCGWKQDTTENTDWVITKGESSTGGPDMDHTNDNNQGNYVMVRSSNIVPNRTARLTSGNIYQENPVCLTFWYHMHGENPGRLNVYVKNMGEKKDPVWTKTGSQGMAWRYAEIEIAQPEKSNKIYFEGIRNTGYGDISLDDIDLLLGNCPPRDFCDFEEPEICGYGQSENDVFDWTWGSGVTPSFRTGPPNDHTYNTQFGHYMYIEVSERSKGDHAHLYSPVFPATGSEERCLSFWYSMNGRDVARLSVYLYQNNQIGDQIWSLQMDQGPHWHLASVPVKSPNIPFQIVFEGIRGNGALGDIAIDDVKLSKEACDPVAFCTFEESVCGWENLHDIGGADFDWARTEAKSVKTGPSVDHTIQKKSGFYMLINTIRGKGGAARLRSQTIPLLPSNPKSYCFHFWYNTQDTKMGQLNINITYHGDTPERIWSYTPGQDSGEPKWHHGMVLIEQPYSHFEIIIEGVSDSSTKGFIALDDLQLLPGTCPNMEKPMYTCHSGLKIPSSKVCDFIKDCPDSDDEEKCAGCTFEDDMCSWKDISNGKFNWTRHQGPLKNNQTKISIDHTKGNKKGWYLFANAYDKLSQTHAVLQNRALQQTSATCQLNFWYYISGHNIGTLSLDALEGGTITNLWKVSHDHGNRWNKAIADIGKISRPFKLQFSGIVDYSYNGVFAVDDIELQDCNFPEPQTSCTDREFQCKRMGCVDKSRICDLSDDCGDGSDETGCEKYTSCDFEGSLCSWSQDKSDDFDWTRQYENTNTLWSGPSRDHTKGTSSGYYIYAEGSLPRKKNDKARLLSPLIKPPGNEECWIRFFYHMRGFKMGSLNLYTRTSLSGTYDVVWSKHGHVGDVWERADVKLFSVTYFQVVFEAVVGGDSDIALDDITLTPGCHLADSNIHLPNGTKTEPTPSPCGAGLFQCKSSECILQSHVCDFIKHCKDDSDEKVCGSCNFEDLNNCGWNDVSTGRFQWQSHQGRSPGKFGPQKDHTTGSDIGKYMMVIGANGVYRKHAYLETQPFGSTPDSCQVEFYAYMSGEGAGEISLNVIDPITHEVKKRVANVTGNQGDKWNRFTGKIGAQSAGFALQFDAFPNGRKLSIGIKTDMAIDDVRLFDCEPKAILTTSTSSTISKTVISTSSSVSNIITSTASMAGKTVTSEITKVSNTKKKITSTPKPTTKPLKVCGNDSFTCPTGDHKCFPTAYRCDGHQDCPDNYDEEHCESCLKGLTYCIPKHECILSHRCDGIMDCPDGSDEAACKECRDGFCLNGGTCRMENGLPKCDCKEKDVNFRCLKMETLLQIAGRKKVWVLPLSIIISLICVAILVGVLYILWSRRQRLYPVRRNHEDIGIQNPAYDFDNSIPVDLNLTDDLSPPTFIDPSLNFSNQNSLENPLYSETHTKH